MKKLLPFLLLALIACDKDTTHKFISLSAEDRVTNITYIKDSRTGLCFAENIFQNGTSLFNEYIYVNVPCTPAVEKLIHAP
jgi:hypothetical protein